MPLEYKFRAKPFEEALNLALRSFEPRPSKELIPTTSAVGFRIATDIISGMDLPPYNMAFYDGYAVRFEDTIGATASKPVKLKLIGIVLRKGDERNLKVKKGTTVYVSANAPMPPGTNAVVREEYAEKLGDVINIKREVKLHENVVVKGEDVKSGDILIKRGAILRAQDIGLLLELGVFRVKVYRKPTIGLISTGDELIEELEGGRPFPDNYSVMLASLLNLLGFEARSLGIVHDDIKEIRELILESVDLYDALAVIAGASRGLKDYSGMALESAGRIIFHATRLSPGKVSGIAKVKGKPVFLVPGHIGSAISCLYNFIIPVMSKIYYENIRLVPRVKAVLASDIEARPGSYTFRTVSLKWSKNGDLIAIPHLKRLGGSTLLTILSSAQGFILLPPGSKLSKGELVEVSLFNPLECLRWDYE